jgi:hypothetical protein
MEVRTAAWPAALNQAVQHVWLERSPNMKSTRSACSRRYRVPAPKAEPAPRSTLSIMEDYEDPDSDLTPDERVAILVLMRLVRRRTVAAGLQ